MKFKIVEDVDQGLFCSIGKTIENVVQDIPYTYEDGYYVDKNLNEETVNMVMSQTNGLVVVDRDFKFTG